MNWAEPTDFDELPELDLDELVVFAAALIDSMAGTADLLQLRDRLARRCHRAPLKMAQVLMVLASWVNVDETTAVRDQRIDFLVASRRGLEVRT